MKFIATTSDKVKTLPVVAGQLIFSRDERAIYLDDKDGRTTFQQIIYCVSEVVRQSIVTPLNGFYFVEDTSVLWRYDGSWKQVTAKSDERLVFADELPVQGKPGILYVKGVDIYIWSNTNNMYSRVGAESWEPIA